MEDQEDIDRGGYKQRGGWCDGGSEIERKSDRTRDGRNRVHNIERRMREWEDQEDIDRGGYKQREGWCDGGR